jgi:hypothetical protein
MSRNPGPAVRTLARLTIFSGAKLGANSARRQATSGHTEPASSQVNGMLGYPQ